MTNAKKPANNHSKTIIDVARPDTLKPDLTSKPVLVTNRSILKDPMVIEQATPGIVPVVEPAQLTEPGEKSRIQFSAPPPKADDRAEAHQSTNEPVLAQSSKKAIAQAGAPKLAANKSVQSRPSASDTSENSGEAEDYDSSSAETTEKELTAAAEAQTKHDAAIQKLVDSKQYFLPINAVEKRKTKRFVILGVILSLLLALAWVDVALDAGLIHIGGIKPVTHFFSN